MRQTTNSRSYEACSLLWCNDFRYESVHRAPQGPWDGFAANSERWVADDGSPLHSTHSNLLCERRIRTSSRPPWILVLAVQRTLMGSTPALGRKVHGVPSGKIWKTTLTTVQCCSGCSALMRILWQWHKCNHCIVALWCTTFWPSPLTKRGSNGPPKNFFDRHLWSSRPSPTGCIRDRDEMKNSSFSLTEYMFWVWQKDSVCRVVRVNLHIVMSDERFSTI